jgi:hypothetical protein
LPFVEVNLLFRGRQLQLDNVLLDTGSLGTVFSADKLLGIGVEYEMEDTVHRLRGVGGAEFVFLKPIDEVSFGHLSVHNFEIEVGMMDYGFEIDGILGMDFLLKVGAIIDLSRLEVYPAS